MNGQPHINTTRNVHVWGHEDGFAPWAALRIPATGGRGFGECATMGILRNDTIIGAVVFHNYSPEFGTTEISIAVDTPKAFTRRGINEVFAFAFGHLQCQMVFGQHATESPIRGMWLRWGASEVLIPRMRGRTTDGVVSTLTADQWAVSPFKRKVATNG